MVTDKYFKNSKKFAYGLAGLGVGTAVVAKAGGSTAGLATVASFASPIGMTIGASAAINATKKLNKKKKKSFY